MPSSLRTPLSGTSFLRKSRPPRLKLWLGVKPAVKKKQHVRELAGERVGILVGLAVREGNEVHAARLAKTAKEIGMHFRLRLPYEIRQLYCKKCKMLIVPGRTSRVRVGRSGTRAVRITCLRCGHIYRRILPANKDL